LSNHESSFDIVSNSHHFQTLKAKTKMEQTIGLFDLSTKMGLPSWRFWRCRFDSCRG